ncbi:hypothetical protein V8E55_001920 [Tylopilus felleus]
MPLFLVSVHPTITLLSWRSLQGCEHRNASTHTITSLFTTTESSLAVPEQVLRWLLDQASYLSDPNEAPGLVVREAPSSSPGGSSDGSTDDLCKTTIFDRMWRVGQSVDAIHSENGPRGWTWIVFHIIIGPREIFSLLDINAQAAEMNEAKFLLNVDEKLLPQVSSCSVYQFMDMGFYTTGVSKHLFATSRLAAPDGCESAVYIA